MNKNFFSTTTIFWGGLALLLVVAGAWYVFARPEAPYASLDAFAQCLRDKGVTMYGSKSCPFCQEEKKAFGSSFEYVPYVECPDDPQRCITAGIQGYPTWTFPDGRKIVGKQGLEKLSELSSCPLEKTGSAGK